MVPIEVLFLARHGVSVRSLRVFHGGVFEQVGNQLANWCCGRRLALGKSWARMRSAHASVSESEIDLATSSFGGLPFLFYFFVCLYISFFFDFFTSYFFY